MSQTLGSGTTNPPSQPAPRKRRSIMKTVLIGGAILLAGLAAVIALQPAEMRITRSTSIAAAPEAVFAEVNDFRNWQDWSPWERLDPLMERTYSGSQTGEGAVYHWNGNDEVGEGQMTIEESRPGEFIHIKLEFLKPFAATNAAEFTFTPQGDGTEVTWTMTGEKNFLMKGMCLFMDMDAMIGADFEKGLTQLKEEVESR